MDRKSNLYTSATSISGLRLHENGNSGVNGRRVYVGLRCLMVSALKDFGQLNALVHVIF
jgi:hypothetical protein